MEILTDLFCNHWLLVVISCMAAYLISSVNTSIIVTYIVKHEDIRKLGSGNAGFTNVLRCVGKFPAIITFVGDFLKGVISVLIPYLLTLGWDIPEMQMERSLLMYFAGLLAVIGHMFPIYYKFKGGKGVVTTASVVIMTDWRVLVVELIFFGILFAITKTISKCSLVCSALYPFAAAGVRLLDKAQILPAIAPIKAPTGVFVVCVFVVTFINGIVIIIRHKDNIKRILEGSENKITSDTK